jgi:small-conductance mechanosensitive channel
MFDWPLCFVKRSLSHKLTCAFTCADKFGPKVKGKESKVEIFDKISDFFLFGILSLVWIDILKIKRGNGLSSIFALGGAGTLAFTLACQDLAKKAINGLASEYWCACLLIESTVEV